MPYIGPSYGYADKSPEARERIRIADEVAESVFGNRTTAGAWMHTFTPMIAGSRQMPVDVVLESQAGLDEVLVELERLRPITEPKPLPASLTSAGRKRRKGR